MKIRLAQLNPVIGDIQSNTVRILQEIEKARNEQVGLLILPELAVCGYPPMDLLNVPSFRETIYRANETIIEQSPGISLIFGSITPHEGLGRPCYNSAIVASNRSLVGIQHKTLLPNYDVFDDMRYFEPAVSSVPIELHGIKWGISVCEDIWLNENDYMQYKQNPLDELVKKGADIFVNISASPFTRSKIESRFQMLQRRVKTYQRPLLYVNQVGAQTELIFDGDSLAINGSAELIGRSPRFKEDALDVSFTLVEGESELNFVSSRWQDAGKESLQPEEKSVFEALVLGIRDYVLKSGLSPKVVIGLSGGIDSAVVATLAVEALGKDAVVGIMMPSEFSSEGSVSDSRALAQNLDISCHQIPIHEMVRSFDHAFKDYYKDTPFGLAEENIQSRIRGSILMSWSNKFNAVVLNTGNKSEYAVGYCTLYGDMNGALAVLSDLYKTEVYALAEWLNSSHYRREVIPNSILKKVPSAELRPDQKDSDSLPEYGVLDQLLKGYLEEGLEYEELVQRGFEKGMVKRILKLVDLNEFKRYQSAPGLKLSKIAFGMGRRRPLVQQWMRYREAMS